MSCLVNSTACAHPVGAWHLWTSGGIGLRHLTDPPLAPLSAAQLMPWLLVQRPGGESSELWTSHDGLTRGCPSQAQGSLSLSTRVSSSVLSPGPFSSEGSPLHCLLHPLLGSWLHPELHPPSLPALDSKALLGESTGSLWIPDSPLWPTSHACLGRLGWPHCTPPQLPRPAARAPPSGPPLYPQCFSWTSGTASSPALRILLPPTPSPLCSQMIFSTVTFDRVLIVVTALLGSGANPLSQGARASSPLTLPLVTLYPLGFCHPELFFWFLNFPSSHFRHCAFYLGCHPVSLSPG